MEFKLQSEFKPSGDQPQAIEALVNGVEDKHKHQVLLGITGSGKNIRDGQCCSDTAAPNPSYCA